MFRTLVRTAPGMSHAPTITVLMSFYNDAPWIGETVESIIRQSWADFEFLIIDDGSNDRSLSIVNSFNDERIRLLTNTTNQGLTASLVRGIEEAKGRYIARIDADDIAEPDRLAIQLDFLETHPHIGIVGSTCLTFRDDSPTVGLYNVPLEPLAIFWTALLNNPFAHPTVMIRQDILNKYALNYDPGFITAQDYDLWTRLLERTQGQNLKQPLVKYRLREGVTATKRELQLQTHDFIAHRTIRRTLPNFPITLAGVTQMRSLLVTENFFDETGKLRISQLRESIRLYFDMLSAFLTTYREHPQKHRLKLQETKKIGKLLLKLNRNLKGQELIIPELGRLSRLLWS